MTCDHRADRFREVGHVETALGEQKRADGSREMLAPEEVLKRLSAFS